MWAISLTGTILEKAGRSMGAWSRWVASWGDSRSLAGLEWREIIRRCRSLIIRAIRSSRIKNKMHRSVNFGQIDQIPGHLTQEATIVWNFLLTNQTTLGIRGGFLEIGVWEGKSATLGAMHLLHDEPSILIDINPCDAALARVRKLKPADVCFLQLRSTLAATDPRVRS
jgi:hypothetical protein